jgi:isoleucyl-tRNA synthetase
LEAEVSLPGMDFNEIERKILEFWREKNIFRKSLQKNKGKKNFVFFEGPPTANGQPGMHHVEARAFKDLIPRYKTMRGFFVDRKAGWDTHGLPVELQVEKELGLKNKKDIEKYGIEKFNQKCRESVWKYKDEWEKLTDRIGYWLDMENPYVTYENYYIESIWFILKKIFDKGLMYKGFKVVPHCPRCGTGLSSHEVAQGYKKVKENSVYIKFKIHPNPPLKKEGDTFFLVWTTTPWTLPANVGLAVNSKIDYIKFKTQNAKRKTTTQSEKPAENIEYYIIAKNRLGILDFEYEIVEEIKGKDLIGLKYEPLFKNSNQKESDLKVVAGDFVSTDEGTGIVHLAPAYGEDDLRAGEKENLSVIHTVDQEGIVMSGYNIPGERKFIKEADKDIIEDLRKKNLLFKEESYEHDYPFCWRCDSPLLYYAKNSWFIKMSDLRDKLVKNNKKINWEPAYIKEGRFGEFIREAKDWALSRERYWGTPLPIWSCEKCKEQICVGSKKELGKEIDDLHRPFIDKIKLKCKCGGEMEREKDVIDVWFDSGAMPLAQWGYPETEESEKELKNHYPADYISEAIDQTRGWFYTLLAVATLMEDCGIISDGAPYKNVICLGHVLDAKGKKMSKSKGNVVSPWEMCEKFGADTLRWYLYTVNQAGDPKKFDVKDVQDKNRRIFGTLWNSLVFFQTYADKDFISSEKRSENILDKWIISVFNSVSGEVINCLEKYDVVSAAREIENFIDDLSNWFIRRSRERFQKIMKPSFAKATEGREKNEATQTLYFVLVELAKLIAPFAPFIAENIFQQLTVSSKQITSEESVHLCGYPKPDKKLIDKKLEEQMNQVREIVAKGLALRMEKKIKIRQPLAELRIRNLELRKEKTLIDLIKGELNVKDVVLDKNIKDEIELDTEITKELKEEGLARELVRQIQQMRKEAGLVPQDKIISNFQFLTSNKTLKNVFKNWTDFIKKEISAKTFAEMKGNDKFDLEKEINLDGEKIRIGIRTL